jgi:hypothetical protein
MIDKKDQSEELERRTTPRGLINYAKEYYKGYETINREHPKDIDCLSVKYYLLCHSLELALKSRLRLNGLSYLELKKLGHDLTKCIKILTEKYEFTFDSRTNEMITCLNQYYSNKEFEYFVMGYKSVPVITEIAQSVHSVIKKVDYDVKK